MLGRGAAAAAGVAAWVMAALLARAIWARSARPGLRHGCLADRLTRVCKPGVPAIAPASLAVLEGGRVRVRMLPALRSRLFLIYVLIAPEYL